MLSVNPSILLIDEPTRGIDVGAKSEIHRLLRDLANQGIGVLVISSELPEVIGMCDRVLVIHEGEQSGILDISPYWQDLIKGCILLGAVSLDHIRRAKKK